MRRAALVAVIFTLLLIPQTSQGASQHSQKAQTAQIQKLQKLVRKSRTVVRWWNGRGEWALARQRSSCLTFKGAHREHVCLKARHSLRVHRSRILWATGRISQIQTAMYLAKIRSKIGSESAWQCIYSHEHGSGGWKTNTGNGYYGGLQMDMSFQEAHGLDLLRAKGTANNWTMYEQMMVAERAHDGIRTSDNGRGGVSLWQDSARGYNPWPRTARMCGLL